MSEALKVLKDANLQRYYDRMFAMHGSEGWAELMADIEYMESEHNKLDKVSNEQELWFQKGQLEIMRWLKTHKDRTEAAYNHILDEQEGEAPEPTGGVAKVVK